MSLIEGLDPAAAQQPLASRMRPKDLSEFVGQQHLVGEGKILRQMIERDTIP
jgi:putative ATPase